MIQEDVNFDVPVCRRGSTLRRPHRLTGESLTDLVAATFRARPGEWLSMQQLAAVGGTGGWRTRVSDCRLHLGMRIVNRTRRENGFTVSEYRYLSPDTARTEAA